MAADRARPGRQSHAGGAGAEELLALVIALGERMRAQFEAHVARFDLSPPQAKALRYLAAAGPSPMRALAATLQCDASNITGIVDRLESRGLVERRSGGTDRRVKLLVLTASGHRLAGQLWEQLLERAGVVAGVDGLTPPDQELLLGLLRRLRPAVGDGPGPGCWCSGQAQGNVPPAQEKVPPGD